MQEQQGADEEENLLELTITEADKEKYKRLDIFLADKITHLSRSFIKHLFESGQIALDSPLPVKLELKRLPPVGSSIKVVVPPPLPDDTPAQNIPLDIMYEDEDLLIINKQAGLVVHPGAGNPDGTLVNAVLYHCKTLKGIGDRMRPGIVHRLDKGTSGVMVVAKSQKCHEQLVLKFSKHDIERRYQAIAMGKALPVGGTVKGLIGRHPQNRIKMSAHPREGREAITHYKVLSQFDKCSHVELKLETGRTHQIRVHLSEVLRHPILNDALYANPGEHKQRLGENVAAIIGDYAHPFLHAKVLGFTHPMSGKELYFESPLPELFQRVLDQLQTQPAAIS